MLNLDPKYIQIIRKILSKHIPDKIVWVYGSRIKNKSHPGSDLDLAIRSSVKQEQVSALRAAFSDSHLPILIDILDWESIPEQFKSEIEKEHEIFN